MFGRPRLLRRNADAQHDLRGPVLIVDDSPTVAGIVKATLARLGVEDLHWAASGAEAMKLFHAFDPGLVFMDIQLPDIGGDKIAIQMLALRPDVKLVLITAMPREDPRVRQAVGMGAYDVIEKPLRVERLRQLLALLDAEAKNLRRVL